MLTNNHWVQHTHSYILLQPEAVTFVQTLMQADHLSAPFQIYLKHRLFYVSLNRQKALWRGHYSA